MRSKRGRTFTKCYFVRWWPPRNNDFGFVRGGRMKQILDDGGDIPCRPQCDDTRLVFFFAQLGFCLLADKFFQLANVALNGQRKVLEASLKYAKYFQRKKGYKHCQFQYLEVFQTVGVVSEKLRRLRRNGMKGKQ